MPANHSDYRQAILGDRVLLAGYGYTTFNFSPDSPAEVTRGRILTHIGSNMRYHARMCLLGVHTMADNI